jgi:signal peptidase I
MEATLQDRDRLIVSKIGRTFSRLTGKDYAPERYDIIIFNHNGEFGSEVSEKQLIKRVIGLPGDRVVVNDGAVTVYNTENPDGIPVDQAGPQKDSVDTATPGNAEETVKPGEVYAMGDNRDNSLDSRSFGAIREADIVGKLVLRIYPFDKSQKY